MAGKIIDTGERLILSMAFTNLPGLLCKLARNPFTLSDAQLLTDFSEANYQGYAALPLVYGGLMPGNPGGRAIAIFAPVLFTCAGPTTPNQIYGYWIESPGGVIVGVERFNGVPRPMIALGNTVGIDITIRLWAPV